MYNFRATNKPPKCCQSPILAITMKIAKMGKIVYRQMPTPRELPQQIPTPGQKLGCKSPRVGANFWCKSPRVRGGMVMDEIDTCITHLRNSMADTLI